MNKSLIILFIILLLVRCSKKDSSPTEMLLGTWQLKSAIGYDSTDYCYHRDIYCYNRYEFQEEILTITYDTLKSNGDIHVMEEYKYEFQITLDEYGKVFKSESYYNLEGQLLESMDEEGEWERLEMGAGHYRFMLNFYYLSGFSKVFTDHFQDSFGLMIYEDQIEKTTLTIVIPSRDSLPSSINREATFVLKKI